MTTIYKSDPKGSEWRKWDLHVHTPLTKINDQYLTLDREDIWQKFCERIEHSDVDVFGIADYFSVENYLSVKEKFHAKYPKSKKSVFPQY